MSARHRLSRFIAAAAVFSLAPPLVVAIGSGTPALAATTTTAWQNGSFAQNVSGIVSRSNVVIGKANTAATQFLPLGNGSLGVAEWAANGFTAQLNRSDTMPNRLSPGQVDIPGLSAMTSASNFVGYLDVYNGVLHESGGGMSLTAWVPAGKDELVVDVTGANPGTRQTASVNLWSGRGPTASASGSIASLAQTWVDNSQTGYSGKTFGAMAAITAGGSNVTASTSGSTQALVSFNPNSDGTYRVIVASPSWAGGNANSTASSLIGSDTGASEASLLATQSAWWNTYWANSGLIEANSSDGTAQYMENLHTLYLYFEAGTMHSGQYPGSQAGLADLFNFNQDHQAWYPAGYWLWNLRGQIQANLDSGEFAQNIPIFDMYLNDLPAIQSWTGAQMNGKPGACVPETMRFNGNGYYWGGSITNDASCAVASSPGFNAETITSGAEIALWVWQQYQDTGDVNFLQKYYPLLQQTSTFLLAWQSVGSDGYLHAVANAHETQWQVQDPTTDIAADQALFTATVNAATRLNTDSSLVSQLRGALTHIQPYARTDENSHSQLLGPSADSSGTDVIGTSYQPTAATHNVENLGLEPVWPFGVISDNTVVNGDNLTALADRTYQHRQNVNNPDWTYDSIQAARLDMSSEVANDLVASTKSYQVYPSGLAAWNPGSVDEPYIEQISNVAATLDEAFATDYDGTVRFAPAWPSGWDGSGRVYIQGGSKVDVQVEGGVLATAAIEAGSSGTMSVRNPWSGQQAQVVNGSTGAVVVAATNAATLSVPVTAGQSYLVEQPATPTTSLPFAQVTGTAARGFRQLGSVSIGLGGNTLPAGNTVTVTSPGSQSGTVGTAISALQIHATDSASGQTLSYSAAGLPPGLSISSSGLVSGTPSASGTFTVTVTATDSTGASGAASFTWTVGGGSGNVVSVTNPGSQSGTVGTAISGLQIQGTDSAGQTLTYTAGGLPTGLSISSSGLISGTPSASGTFTVTVTATDSTGASGAASFTWTISGGTTGFPGGYHSLVVAKSSLCLDVFGNTSTAGAAIDQYTCNSQSNQQFQFLPIANGYGELQAQNSGQDVTVANSSTAQGTPDIVQQPVNGAAASLWLPQQQSDGSWQFKNQNSGLCLDVYGNGSTTGQQLDQWPCKNAPGTNQDFNPR
ncbi:Ricin B lectin [Catenulispora acidiphila DSM 44928]|uniref:Ricin B lectin n=1 Tax=Catenulispora acidiphila (strain DSM 44928 / JCM 14897 / NBRC 102108 / NRRL B-24433 / ID139908) TaxID=479433 RepID=C7PZJ4_CATAD|nr:Ricin B lectin [Catenulispora acidiphila DSM 44928]